MMLNFDNQQGKAIALFEKGKIHHIPIQSITHIRSNDYLLTFYLICNANKFTVTGKLGEYEANLKDFGFFKINRSCIVSLTKVKTFDCTRQKVTIDDIELTVSRSHSKKLRKFFLSLS